MGEDGICGPCERDVANGACCSCTLTIKQLDYDKKRSRELTTLRASLEDAEKELKMYKQALTKAVSLPAKELPNTKQYYTWNNNGNVEVATR